MADAELQRVPTLHGDLLLSPTAPFFSDSPPLLGPCELQDPLWAKMSTAVAGANKKRKKPDTKPQSQINKCLNEKRRREQENIYIEELAELISASFADMSSLSVKPDKCAILQETVNQIRHIKQQEAAATTDAVQQGEVSSSKPTILANEVFGPLLLEALEGFLFVVNTEGKVEYVTENVSQFIKYNKEEVLGKSIYNYLHHGDHARFSSSLLPMSVGWTPLEQAQHPPRNRTFNCRFLIKPPDDQDETMEEKQQRVSKYENMQISSTQLPYGGEKGGGGGGEAEESGEVGPCLMCVARRIPPNEKHIGTPIEQFTMKLDTVGKIIGVDTSGVSSTYSQYLNKDLINRSIEELCHMHDLSKLSSHLKETLNVGQSTSAIYRLRVSNTQDKYIHVQTKSKLFKASTHEPDFLMATHSIIGDTDLATDASSPASLGGQSSSSSVGGPLIANVNGGNRGVTSSELTNTINLNNTSTTQFNSDLSFEFDIFPSSTWELLGGGEERGVWERPESRASLTPAPSPLNPYSAPPQPSPVPPTPPSFQQPAPAFPFSPLQDPPHHPDDTKDSKEGESGSEGGESARLRNLLMTKRPSTDSDDGGGQRNKHRILKGLLNQDDDEHTPDQPKSATTANNMLLKLLNEKSDDDDVEARAGLKKQSELLQQLFKEEGNNQEGNQSEDSLMKNLESLGRSRKRPSEEGDEGGGGKRPGAASLLDSLPPVPPTTSSGNSKLWEKNKMLASLLAKQPSTPTTIPPIPASVISATPQDKLPRIIKQSPCWVSNMQQSGSGQVNQTGGQGQVRPQQQQRSPAPATRTNYQHQQSWDTSDPILSDLLDQVIEIVPDTVTDSPALINMINSMDSPTSGGSSSNTSFQQDLNEKMAINAIQKSLMLCETAVKSPSYNSSALSQGQQPFPPPPIYQQRPRFPIQGQLANRQPNHQFSITNQQQQQQLLLQHRSKLMQQQQQQQKQRLLQQQQQQQLLIPSNAAATDPGIHNIDSLINNTVAPNVSLQRSSSVPDSQLSPVGVGNYNSPGSSNLLNSGGSQISPGQRQPYSPQPFSPVNGGMNSFQSSTGQQGGQQARLSPSGLPNFQQAQLSPRVSQGQQVYSSQAQSNSWSQQQANRISLQQQQNPMLNAQLTGGGGGTSGGGFGGGRGGFVGGQRQQLPPVRSLTSPGSRQSPFPPEISPTTATSYQFRLQRTISAPPQATTQLPGPRLLGKDHGGLPLLSPPYPHHPVLYPTDSGHFCFEQNPHLYASDRARHPGGSNGVTEFVRQELRAMVGARTGVPRQNVAQQVLPGQPVSSADLDALGLSFDMTSPTVSESPKMWSNMSDLGNSSPQPGAALSARNSMEEVSRSNDQKSSLLQKLLSE